MTKNLILNNVIYDKVIIWGLKGTNHTHKYIHDAFYKAFTHMDYNTYWVNSIKELNVTAENSFILYTGIKYDECPVHSVEEPPILASCFYCLHNCHSNIITEIKNICGFNKLLNIQVYTTDCISKSHKLKNHKLTYLQKDRSILFFPWGTNLLPNEIDKNIKNYDKINSNNIYSFRHIGSMTQGWNKPYNILKTVLNRNKITFETKGGWPDNISEEESRFFLQEAVFLPSLQIKWQLVKEYIPCRIFKNISYGKFGITNNSAVNTLFDNKLVYDSNIKTLVRKSIDFENQSYNTKKNIVIDLMNDVKKNHTYISRIETIFDVINNREMINNIIENTNQNNIPRQHFQSQHIGIKGIKQKHMFNMMNWKRK